MPIKQNVVVNAVVLALSLLFCVPLAQAKPIEDPNLIPLSKEQSDVYESFDIYVIKNSIKNQKKNNVLFDLLVTGVSTAKTTYADESDPINEEDKIGEYNMDQSSVILKASMDCSTMHTKINTIVSKDPETGNIVEDKPDSSEQDTERNKLLKPILCG